MNINLKTSDLFECKTDYLKELFDASTYPWDMIPLIKDYIISLVFKGIPDFKKLSDMVLVGENVKIHPSAVIIPPAILGDETELRPGSFIRGNVITGRGCVIGNSTEIKNSILLDGVQVPHYNYVGDSILGNKAHMGAGSICSNLKSDGKNIVIHMDTPINTGLRKLGAILADNADIGCSCVLNPGTVVGKGTRVYPLLALRGVYPGNSIVKSADKYVKMV